MSYAAALVLTVVCFTGIALFVHGARCVRGALQFRRRSIALRAAQRPDEVGDPPPFASTPFSVYRRQAVFVCPLLGTRRVVTEQVASGRQSYWMPGATLPVRVALAPPHVAVVDTFRNVYLFPLAYMVAGAAFAVVIPLGVLTA